MVRGRIPEDEEAAREGWEGILAMLGNVRVYSHLVRDRVKAARIAGEVDLLDVALDDLGRLDRLVIRVQDCIKREA